MNSRKAMLIIMDGWGLGQVPASDAIAHARTPFVSNLYNVYPHTTLTTCGEAVGLPAGQMGNSEVGHLNLGAGRIVYQELERINVSIRNGSLAENPELMAAIEYAKQHGKTLHLMGLVSDGGVHAHINHLKALLDICKKNQLTNVLVHAFTDGRDTDPKSGWGFLKELTEYMQQTTGNLATITGRYYAMDRDKRWERVKIAYDALVNGTGNASNDMLASVAESYALDVTDEFMMPIINAGLTKTNIEANDAVICFNFRTDRCREITEVLTQVEKHEYNMHTLPLFYCTFTEYDQSYKGVHTFFKTDNLFQTLGEVLSMAGKTQLRMAETEKYPHVSFFFSGGREIPFTGEDRLMVPSPKVPTYDLKPEMSAPELAAAAVEKIQSGTYDFICINFANPDMVGHTGVWNAIIRAVETVDTCVQQVITAALEQDYIILLTADHGNADYAINEDGSPNTAHTLNPVPMFVIDKHKHHTVHPGKLGDVAPTLLQLMGLEIPAAMTGNVLVDN
ncbi:MAG TPA: 2,3-bisphosphoglycerate-independent phosphoglycerate mutase [Ferruginibacter sp.]|nr:2,3-bisphosphoglycerate-independent phosphoglycerate mutase [Ferruginibacter sp.]HRO16945.1 2,3-bisphosphoglycerate-independent phosphoglycerate mutase [Ferruginibacter sp.]